MKILKLLACLITLPILGLIYAYAIWYIPFIYINFLLSAFFGAAIGYVIFYCIGNVGTFFGIILTFFALYFHWATWASLALNTGERFGPFVSTNIDISQVFTLISNPSLLMDYISRINNVGTWKIGSTEINGIFLFLIWIVETLIISTVSIFVMHGED